VAAVTAVQALGLVVLQLQAGGEPTALRLSALTDDDALPPGVCLATVGLSLEPLGVGGVDTTQSRKTQHFTHAEPSRFGTRSLPSHVSRDVYVCVGSTYLSLGSSQANTHRR
jgi:hypothetical protein